MWLWLLLLLACGREEELPVVFEEPERSPAEPVAGHPIPPPARFLPSPAAEGPGSLRLAPPDLTKVVGEREERIGEGWASQDGRLAVVIAAGATGGATALAVVDADGNELGVIPFGGYPDGGWSTPRWSTDGRWLATAQPMGDTHTVQVFDTSARSLQDPLGGVSAFGWAPDLPLLVLTYLPGSDANVVAPIFKFYLPDRREVVSPIPESEDVGYQYVGFAQTGEIEYREMRRLVGGGGQVWDPVGERRGALSPDKTRILTR